MSVLTPARLNALKSWPKLNQNWHFLSATALATINRPKDIAVLYDYTLKQLPRGEHDQVTAKFRESILKSTALIGLPRVINGLLELYNVTPKELQATKQLRPERLDWHKDGHEFFGQVYGKITERVRNNLIKTYPDLYFYIENFVYGPLLSPLLVLDPKETSFTVLSALVPQDVNHELKGHLKGALNNGATVEEVNSLRDMLVELSTWYDIKFTEQPQKLKE